MKCQSCDLSENGGFDRCQAEATEVIWCPTWITAADGPMHVCARHAANFKPEHNPHAKNGKFYWGQEAMSAFAAGY